MKDVILASSSPRRKGLLASIIPNFLIIPSSVNEELDPHICPDEAVILLAERKCKDIFESHLDKIVIGSDTIVVFEGRILGKPVDKADARRTLKMLSGKTHEVLTGVCIMSGERCVKAFDRTYVTMNEFSDRFIDEYVDSGSPLDKAASYGIQDGGIVKAYEGSYTNVVGLPVELTEKLLKEVNR